MTTPQRPMARLDTTDADGRTVAVDLATDAGALVVRNPAGLDDFDTSDIPALLTEGAKAGVTAMRGRRLGPICVGVLRGRHLAWECRLSKAGLMIGGGRWGLAIRRSTRTT